MFQHLRLEVERRLDAIDKIQCEPWLLSKTVKEQFEEGDISQGKIFLSISFYTYFLD